MRSCETDCGYWKPEAFDGKSEWNDRKSEVPVEWQSDETAVWKSGRLQIPGGKPVQSVWQPAYVVWQPAYVVGQPAYVVGQPENIVRQPI